MKFDKPTLVSITAPTASGKNFLLYELQNRYGMSKILSTTTRAPRDGEVDGVDYKFISDSVSKSLEEMGEFAELVTFRGVRYGVTNNEMERKMLSGSSPLIILEPNGVNQYRKILSAKGWDIFTVYVHTPENVRTERLCHRTAMDIVAEASDSNKLFGEVFQGIKKQISIHTCRVQSMLTEEREWSNTNIWDVIVPGDDSVKALDLIERGIHWRNKKTAEPQPYDHKM
jgi:guanylate kinase